VKPVELSGTKQEVYERKN